MSDSSSDRTARIKAAFGGARRYDEAAIVQRGVAEALARRIAAAARPPQPAILELGCGTGFLTRAVSEAIGPARWTVSDIAPEMVARTRAALGLAADYRVIDGEAVDPSLGPFDLIISSLAFQWFANPAAAIRRLSLLLAADGLIAFATMAAGSFAEWTAALDAEALPRGTPAYPDRAALTALAPEGFTADVEIVDMPELQPDARSFLRRLKAIGAGTPAESYLPLPAAALRRAMARFDAGSRTVTYRIGFCLFRRIAD